MKLNKDNYELVMFDLLEGNLSEEEELHVMDQIEGDEFLFREWKLFKSSVLIADKDIIFEGKANLLKEEKIAIMPIYSRWMAVAASVTILAAVFIFWPTSTPPQVVTAAEISIQDTEEVLAGADNIADEIEETLETDKGDFERLAKVVTPEERIVIASFESDDLDKSEKYNTVNKKTLAQEDVQMSKEEAKAILEDKIVEEVKTELIAKVPTTAKEQLRDEINLPTKPRNSVTTTTDDARAVVVPKTGREKIVAFVTNRPLERIATITASILMKVRNPTLQVKPDFKDRRPSLKIEFESEGYQAIASIEPFKNRNN
jgi:hypothetical protein